MYLISYGLLRAAHSHNPAGMSIFALLRTASCSYLLPSKTHSVSYARFACDEPVCAFEELIKYVACATGYFWRGGIIYLVV